MNRLLNSYAARVFAFLLCCILGLGTMVCALSFAYCRYEPGMGTGDERNFFQSELAYEYAQSQVWNAMQSVYLADRPESRDTNSYIPVREPEDPFSCVIYRADGSVAADTRKSGSRRISADTVFEWTDGYTAECYVNLPARRGTLLYNYVTLYDFLYNGRDLFLPIGMGCAALTLLLFVFLMAAAGRTPEGVKLGGFHRWPLELYALLLGTGAAGCVAALLEVVRQDISRYSDVFAAACGTMILGAGMFCLLGCMTLSARFRAGKWWRNTVTFFCLKWGWRLMSWCGRLLLRCALRLWKGLRGFVRGAGRAALALPLFWKAAVVYGAFVLVNIILSLNSIWNGDGWMALLFFIDLAGLAAVIWAAQQLKKLRDAGRALAAGDLGYTVDTARMLPALKEHAENLSAVRLGMSRAVDERMKSERFRTELITNVSHDLKTPLTSIVSYVDLLKNEPIESEKAREYIDVLDRQSQRLKKLTADLVDASKASSGALTVNPEPVDLGELVRQSAGEYAERFAAASLTPVLGLREEETVVTADGRLLWRVLDNLLTNAVKYSLPGTRVYLDVTKSPGTASISVKNISREALNIPAEELMERFVRGDASRSSEGSGLGLSIARSLTELMGGELRITLDGDLFKAEILFPSGTK